MYIMTFVTALIGFVLSLFFVCMIGCVFLLLIYVVEQYRYSHYDTLHGYDLTPFASHYVS